MGNKNIKKIVFWGATGQAKVLRECISHYGFRLLALFDNNTGLAAPFKDVPLYYGMSGFNNWLNSQKERDIFFLVAIGGNQGEARYLIHNNLKKCCLIPVSVIHPTAFVASNAEIGLGSQILANASVCVNARLGETTIINTGAIVDHECVLGNGVHLAPGVNLAGCVEIGDFTMIGTGAIVLPQVKIGKNAGIGAGSVVTRDIPDSVIAYGNPARIIRER